MGHVHSTCSITDPFCVHAKGASRPDGGPPTIPYQIRAVLSLTADGTTGTARYTFVPNISFGYIAATNAAGTFTNGATWTNLGGNAFVTSNAKELRIVSFGVIIRSVMSATNAKGLVILTTDPAPFVSATNQAGSMQGQESVILTLAAGMEHTWVSKPLGVTAHQLRPTSAFTSTMSDFDWTSLVVEVSGGDTTSATPYLSVEYVMNVEFTVQSSQSSNLAMLQKPPAVPNRVATAAAERVHAKTSSFIEGGIASAVKTMESYAKSALDDVLSDGMALLFM